MTTAGPNFFESLPFLKIMTPQLWIAVSTSDGDSHVYMYPRSEKNPGSENPVLSYLFDTCHLFDTSADSERLTDKTLAYHKVKLRPPVAGTSPRLPPDMGSIRPSALRVGTATPPSGRQ